MLIASSVMSEVLVICGVLVEAVSHLRNRRLANQHTYSTPSINQEQAKWQDITDLCEREVASRIIPLRTSLSSHP